METRIFSEYEMSDYDLKILIIKSAIEILINTPDAYYKDLTLKLNPNLEAGLFIKELLVFVPELKGFGIEDSRLSASNQLKLAAINLDFILKNEKLRQVMENTWRIFFSSSLLSLRYGIMTGFIEKTLNEKTFNKPEIINRLSNYITNGVDVDAFTMIIFAEEEISRITNNEKTPKVYDRIMSDHFEQIEFYLDSIMGSRVYNMLHEVFTEAIDKSLPELFDKLGIPQENAKEISKKTKFNFSNYLNQSVKEKFPDLRGGSRRREKSVWTNENKIKFYETFEKLPQIKGKMLWDFAYEQLNENNFHYKYIDLLRTETPFKEVPEQLFSEAVRTWEKYKNSFAKPKPEEKPLRFAFQHTLHLLNFPKTAFSTMVAYKREGKKLCTINKLSNENSK